MIRSILTKTNNNLVYNKSLGLPIRSILQQQQIHNIHNNSNNIYKQNVINNQLNNNNTLLNRSSLNNNNNNKTILFNQQNNNNNGILQKRLVSTWGIRFLLGFSIVGFMFFMRRWTPRQVKRIIKIFKEKQAYEQYLPEVYKMSFDRVKEERYLSSFLASPPVGPVCIVGPDGCGKSHIVKRVISARSMSVLVDMRQNAVMSGDELLLQFVKKLGYLLPSDDLISSLFIKGDKKQLINVKEIVQGLETIFMSLLQMKEQYKEIPLIVITNIEALPTSDNFTRFLDWCISVTDNKLANIVFLTSSQFVHFHLDSNYSFKKRRFLYNISYPSVDDVKKYLTSILIKSNHIPTTSTLEENMTLSHINRNLNENINNEIIITPTTSSTTSISQTTISNMEIHKDTTDEDSSVALTSQDIDCIIHNFGGQMRDIDALVGLIKKGESLHYVIEMFIAETAQKIGALVDAMFQRANLADSDSEKKAIFEKYMRFWSMLESLLADGTVQASDLIERVFHEQPEELDEYFKTNLIYYWTKQQREIVMPEVELSTPTMKSVYDTYVTFSSPRIHRAVERVIKDHRFVLQRHSIDKFFKKADLKDDRKDLEEEKRDLQSEYEKIYQRLENLIENNQEWIKFMGIEKFDERRRQFMEMEDKYLAKINSITLKLEKIENDLDNL